MFVGPDAKRRRNRRRPLSPLLRHHIMLRRAILLDKLFPGAPRSSGLTVAPSFCAPADLRVRGSSWRLGAGNCRSGNQQPVVRRDRWSATGDPPIAVAAGLDPQRPLRPNSRLWLRKVCIATSVATRPSELHIRTSAFIRQSGPGCKADGVYRTTSQSPYWPLVTQHYPLLSTWWTANWKLC